MRILRHIESGEFVSHPRTDDEPAVGLDPAYEEFWLVQMELPTLTPQQTAERFEEVNEETKTVTRGWRITHLPEPPPPGPDYLGFWDAALVSEAYGVLLGHAMANLPTNTALTAFIAAFQDAKEGRPNQGALQACIYLVMGAAKDVLTAENLAELQVLMDSFDLASQYTLSPPKP